jgi:molybdopterin/thiamine biosynthesis adenylyltransferase
MKIFDPQVFGNRRIDIIGAGATGSRIALSLAKLGVQNLHVWDFDTIAEHNIANQAYSVSDIGRLKVEALADLIEEATGLHIEQHPVAVDADTQLGEAVFLLTDTMKSRRLIWEGAVKFKPLTNVMIETRMGAETGRVYTTNPSDYDEGKAWEATLCEDTEAADSLCGSRITVGPTAEIISGLAVWQFMRWVTWYATGENKPDSEVIFAVRPMCMMSRQFVASGAAPALQ